MNTSQYQLFHVASTASDRALSFNSEQQRNKRPPHLPRTFARSQSSVFRVNEARSTNPANIPRHLQNPPLSSHTRIQKAPALLLNSALPGTEHSLDCSSPDERANEHPDPSSSSSTVTMIRSTQIARLDGTYPPRQTPITTGGERNIGVANTSR